MSEIQKTTLKIKLQQEKTSKKNPRVTLTVRDDKGKMIQYARNDLLGLISMLNKFDSKLHTDKEWKMFLKVKDKLTEHAIKKEVPSEVIVGFTLDEATFLKNYLVEFQEKEGKNVSLAEYEIRAAVIVREQLE